MKSASRRTKPGPWQVARLAMKWLVVQPGRALLGWGDNLVHDAERREVVVQRALPPSTLTGPDALALKEAYARMSERIDPRGRSVGRRLRHLAVGGFFFGLGIFTLISLFSSSRGRGAVTIEYIFLGFGLLGLVVLVSQLAIGMKWIPNWRPVGSADDVARGWLEESRCPGCLYQFSTATPHEVVVRCSECGAAWKIDQLILRAP